MTEIKPIKDYLRKLQKVINSEVVFKLFGRALIKKGRIDDVLACIYAVLPDSYKKQLKARNRAFQSIVMYRLLTEKLANKFILDSSLVLVKLGEVNSLLTLVISKIESDIRMIEEKTS